MALKLKIVVAEVAVSISYQYAILLSTASATFFLGGIMRKPLPRPNKYFVAIPNEFFNGWLKELEPSETHLLNFIMRKTLGYRKEEDWISISQFVKDTKLSKNTVLKCLHSLENKEMIFKKQTGEGRGIRTYWKLNIEGIGAKNEPIDESIGAENGKVLVQNLTGIGAKIAPTKNSTTKDIFTKEKKIESQRDAIPETNSWKLFIAHYYKIYKELTGGEPVLVNIDFRNLKFIATPLKNKDNWQDVLKTAMENCYKKAKDSKGSRFEIRFETTELYKHFADYCSDKCEYSIFERKKL